MENWYMYHLFAMNISHSWRYNIPVFHGSVMGIGVLKLDLVKMIRVLWEILPAPSGNHMALGCTWCLPVKTSIFLIMFLGYGFFKWLMCSGPSLLPLSMIFEWMGTFPLGVSGDTWFIGTKKGNSWLTYVQYLYSTKKGKILMMSCTGMESEQKAYRCLLE